MERAEKREFVSEMNGVLSNAGSVVVAHYSGLTVADMTEFRGQVREVGGTVKVAKNRLVKLALKGTEAEHMAPLFQGQTLIAYAEDPVAAPKAAAEFAKKNEKLVILGGAMGNLIDRIFRGYVVDSFDVYWQSWHWPAFNLADIAIVLGTVLFLYVSFIPEKSGTNVELDGSG